MQGKDNHSNYNDQDLKNNVAISPNSNAIHRSSRERVESEWVYQGRANRKRRRRRKKVLGASLITAGALLCLLAIAFMLSGDKVSEEAPYVTEIGGMPVVHDIVEADTLGRPGTVRKIKYIVIHETGNDNSGANAQAHNSYIHKTVVTDRLSWHYTVDDSGVYHHLPDNEVGFHAGDSSQGEGGNLNGIGVEMCVNPDGDYEQTLKNTAKLTAWLMTEYKLKPKDIVTHYDCSGKYCPQELLAADRWDEFIQMVEDARREL